MGQRKGETAWQIATYKKWKHMTWDFWGEIRINNYNTLIVLVSYSNKIGLNVSKVSITEASRKYISSLFILNSKTFKMCVMWYVWNLKLHRGKTKLSIGFLYPGVIMNFTLALINRIFLGKRCSFHLHFLVKNSYQRRKCRNMKRLWNTCI